MDLVLVYGIEAAALQPAPGGRANAKMVSKRTFESLSLRYSDGCYYLRNDRIFGAIVLDPTSFQMVSQGREISDEANKMIKEGMKQERKHDIDLVRDFLKVAHEKCEECTRSIVDTAVHLIKHESPFPLPLMQPVGVEKQATKVEKREEKKRSTIIKGQNEFTYSQHLDFPKSMLDAVESRALMTGVDRLNPILRQRFAKGALMQEAGDVELAANAKKPAD